MASASLQAHTHPLLGKALGPSTEITGHVDVGDWLAPVRVCVRRGHERADLLRVARALRRQARALAVQAKTGRAEWRAWIKGTAKVPESTCPLEPFAARLAGNRRAGGAKAGPSRAKAASEAPRAARQRKKLPPGVLC